MKINEYIQQCIVSATSRAGLDTSCLSKSTVSTPKQKGHGDVASNAAMILASQARSNPRQIAQTLIDNFDLDPAYIADVSIAGPGFINFTMSNDYLFEGLAGIIQMGENYGCSQWGGGAKTQVEFVSANPTGPLTIGHGRQAVLGDTVARLLEATGHDVFREYYFNDAGRQMRVLGDSVRLRYLELLGEDAVLSEDHYQGEYIRDIAQTAIDEKGNSLKDSDELEYFKKLAEHAIFEEIKRTISRLGFEFDRFFNELSLYESGKIDEVKAILDRKGLIYESEGATWLKTTDMGMDQDRVIIKSSGEPTYRLPDIAYHRDKMERGFDLVVDIFGSDHVATYPDVLAALDAMDYDKAKVKVLIHQFVTLMEGKEKVKMSTRKANFVTLDELMDEVGTDVTRYFFLNRSMNSHLNFDLSLAKTESDENPVYYVQYAHARTCSVIRHAEEQGHDLSTEADITLLDAPEELALMKILLIYPDIVSLAAREYAPHKIPTYLEEAASAYHRFQHAGKVDASLRVVTDNVHTTAARIVLCRATRLVLANGLHLLGISAPEKM
ncbi:arginine--tRNA ligase [bacterium]|nr:arginine--tRNA ligase [bacterium]